MSIIQAFDVWHTMRDSRRSVSGKSKDKILMEDELSQSQGHLFTNGQIPRLQVD